MRVSLLADSVLGGKSFDGPALTRALDRTGMSYTLTSYASPIRTIKAELPILPEVIESQPHLVVIAHGVAEAMLPTFERWRPSEAGGLATKGELVSGLLRNNRQGAALRRGLRHLVTKVRARRPLVAWDDFCGTYQDVVKQLLAETSCELLLVGMCGGDPDYFPYERRRIGEVADLLGAISRMDQSRIHVVLPMGHVHEWNHFASDRIHLNTDGEEVLSTLLHTALSRSPLVLP